MMQESIPMSPTATASWGPLPGQSLNALLALVGSKKMSVAALRTRMGLTPTAFASLLNWLQREYLVDVVSNHSGSKVEENVELTEKGEAFLVGVLERTCELPELR